MTCKPAFVLLAAFAAASQQGQLPRPDRMGVVNAGPYDYGVMGPPATSAMVAAADKAVAKPLPPGPFQPAWDSIQKNYRAPAWVEDAKFGIFLAFTAASRAIAAGS